MLELPMGLALIPCDAVIEDTRTHKKSIIGLFSRISADSFPYTHPSMTVLVTLTGCHGTCPCILTCEKHGGIQPVIKVDCNVAARSPKDVIDIVINIKSVILTEPGVYVFKLLCNDIPVMMRPVSVVQKIKNRVTPQAPEEQP